MWQVPSCISSQSPRLHASNPNLSTSDSNTQELCPESPDSPTDVSLLQQDFCRLANNSESMLVSLICQSFYYFILFAPLLHYFSPVHGRLKSTLSTLLAERDRLRHTIDLQAPQPVQVMGLKTAYASVSVSTAPACLSKTLSVNYLPLSGLFRWPPLFGTPGIQWEQSIYPWVNIRVFWCTRVPAFLFILWKWGKTIPAVLSFWL